MSPDGNCDPEKIPKLIKEIKNKKSDIVIGSRYLGGKKSDDDDLVTAFGNWLFRFLISLNTGDHEIKHSLFDNTSLLIHIFSSLFSYSMLTISELALYVFF